jgi:hypothetical protein
MTFVANCLIVSALEGTMDEQERNAVLFNIRVLEFHQAMVAHRIRGEYVYYLTEMWFMWPDFGYDAEHGYILN